MRLEELAPFPAAALDAELARHPHARQVVWAQEEPLNAGAWAFVEPHAAPLLAARQLAPLAYAGRPALAAPAEGTGTLHKAGHAAYIASVFPKA